MAQSKMAGAHLADGRAAGSARELGVASFDWVLRTSHAGGFARDHDAPLLDKDSAGGLGAGGFGFFARNTGAPYSSAGNFAGDHGGLLVDKDRVGELGRGEADNTGAPFAGLGAPYSRAGGFTRDHGALLGDKDRAGGLAQVGAADFLARDTFAPFAGLGALYSSAGVLAGEHGEPFDKAEGMAAAGAAPSSPNAGQVTIDVDISTDAGVPAAADGRDGNLAAAVVGIIAASSAVTMVVAAGDVSPPVAFGLFVLLLGGLSLAASGVRRV